MQRQEGGGGGGGGGSSEEECYNVIQTNKSAASTAPYPTTVLTSSKFHNSVKNKMFSTCVLLHFLQGFKNISETFFKL